MRRLESLEEHIGGKLFNRTPDGYKPTALADQLLPTAKTVEQTLVEAERQVSGKDSELSGRVKLSLPAVPVTHISESVAEFALKYPRIELDISVSDEPVDLARREADIAVRGLPKDKRPPKDIVGIKIGRISLGYYVHKELLSEAARGQRQLTCIRASHTVLNLGDLPAPEKWPSVWDTSVEEQIKAA